MKHCLAAKGVHIVDVAINYSENDQLTRDLKALACEVECSDAEPEEEVITTKNETSTKSARETLTVASPYDRSTIATLELHDADEVEASLARAKVLFNRRAGWLAPHQRIAILEKLAAIMETRKDVLIKIAVSEGGKPHMDTVVEVDRAIQGVKLGIQAIHLAPWRAGPHGV